MLWIHKKCSGIKGSLHHDPDFSCAGCLGKALPIDGRLVKEVLVDDENVEAVPEFCYLGDMFSVGGGCGLAAVTHCKSAWGKFSQLLPLHTNHNLPGLTRDRVYSTYVLPHAAETWAMTVATLYCLQHDDRAMMCWVCNFKANDEVSSDSLLSKLGLSI